MKRPATVLAVLPLLAVPAARAGHEDPYHARKKILRLADEVADTARLVHRTASRSHPGHGKHGRYGDRGSAYRSHALRALYELEHRARDFEHAVEYLPLYETHREYETLARSFGRAADTLYRAHLGYRVQRDFDCLAEYMHSLTGYYEEYAYPRRVRHRGYDNRGYNRIEVYAPRWNVDLGWPSRGWRYDDEDSDSY